MTFTESNRLLPLLRRVTPGGSQTMSKSASRFPVGAYPVAVTHGSGATVTDVDGNTYVDWICGLGALAIGHAHPYVVSAVCDQAKRGAIFSLPSALEYDVSAQFLDGSPWPGGMVRWTKTGSESCAAAVRIARRATGRSVIVTPRAGYHGWHDWFQVLKPVHPGIPEFMRDGVASFDFNDLLSLENTMAEYDGRVAAVMLEPTLVTAPKPGFLRAVVDCAHRHGALAIFDEMVCGGRWRYYGGSEWTQVTPDLATFGKAIAGGYPAACVVGDASIMEYGDVISGTFGGDAIGLSAVAATRLVYDIEPIIDRQWSFGSRLMQAVNGSSPYVSLVGYPVHPVPTAGSQEIMTLLVQELAEHGVLIHPAGFNVSGVLTEDEFARSLHAWEEALRVVAIGVSTNNVTRLLRGDVMRPAGVRT